MTKTQANMENAMNNIGKTAAVYEFIGGLFGWVWLISWPVVVYFVVKTIWYHGVWWHACVAFGVGFLCKCVMISYNVEKNKIMDNQRRVPAPESIRGMVRGVDEKNNMLTVHHIFSCGDGLKDIAIFMVRIEKGVISLLNIKVGDWVDFDDLGDMPFEGQEVHIGEFNAHYGDKFTKRIADADGTSLTEIKKELVGMYTGALSDSLNRQGASKEAGLNVIMAFTRDYSIAQFGIDPVEIGRAARAAQ